MVWASKKRYPRRKRRGLIEARGRVRGKFGHAASIRGGNAEASLKPVLGRVQPHLQPGRYPRRKRRGLIEVAS